MKEAALLIVLLSAAAEGTPHLNCSITKSQDGSFIYQISENPTSSKCITSWEYRNGTVIVDIHGNADSHLVKNNTLHSVELKSCKDFLLHKRECGGVQLEVSCLVNCSLFVVKKHLPSWVCFSLNICIDKATAVVSAATVSSILLLLLLFWWVFRKWKTGGCRCAQRLYAPPSDHIQIPIQMGEKGMSETPHPD